MILSHRYLEYNLRQYSAVLLCRIWNKTEKILYQPDETVRLEARLEDETVWLTQAQMSELFQRERTVITKHINNMFKKVELDEKSKVHFLHLANSDKPVNFTVWMLSYQLVIG